MTATATIQRSDSLLQLALQLDLPPIDLVDGQVAAVERAHQEFVWGHEYHWCEQAFAAGQSLRKCPSVSFVGSGSTRHVFAWENSNSVVKVPTDLEAARYNQLEVAYYEKSAFYGHAVVPCRLVWTTNGVPLVVMEKVHLGNRYAADKPEWGYQNDGGQIARSPMLGGQWAAYDATFPLFDWTPYSRADNPMSYRQGADHEYSRLVTDHVL